MAFRAGADEVAQLRRLRVGEELLRGAALPDLALVHEDGRARDIAGEAHLVGHEQHRHAVLRQLLHDQQHLAGQLGVERRGHLVEEHDLGPHRQRPGDRDTLLLAARELRGEGVELVLEADAPQHFTRELTGFLGRLLLHHAWRQGDVLADGQMRKQVEALEDDADLLPELAQVGFGIVDPHPIDADGSGLDRFQPVDAAQQRALARARAPDDRHDLALGDVQRDILEHGHCAVTLVDPLDFNERHRASARASGSIGSEGSRGRNRCRRR